MQRELVTFRATCHVLLARDGAVRQSPELESLIFQALRVPLHSCKSAVRVWFSWTVRHKDAIYLFFIFSLGLMSSTPAGQSPEPSPLITVPRVIVATTAMLTFISFWRAAAIVLNDLASSAYYAGGESESFIGKSAPWFILGVMLFSYCVRAVYVESCSMFVRGGVYRVVKEALGGTLAKFSVSALMFDYVLTGPISGVSAGQYLAGLLNELFAYFHMGIVAFREFDGRVLRHPGDALFLVGEHQGHSRIERQSAEDHAGHHGDGGDADRLVHLHDLGPRRAPAAAARARQYSCWTSARSDGCTAARSCT